jgi:hypothetical protein
MPYWESGDITPRILNLGTRWRWVFSFTARSLYPRRKSPRYPLDGRLGGPQSRAGRGGEEEKSHHCLCQELNPSRPARSVVPTLTELPRLLTCDRSVSRLDGRTWITGGDIWMFLYPITDLVQLCNGGALDLKSGGSWLESQPDSR